MKLFSNYIKESVCEINGFCILKPEFMEYEEDWLKMLSNNGWNTIQKKKITLDKKTSEELYSPHKDKDFYNDLINYMCSDTCLCCTCQKECKDPIKDMNDLKDRVRKTWGKDEMRNAMHSSDSLDNVKRESNIIFN